MDYFWVIIIVVIGKGWKIISKIGIESKTVPVVQGCITAEAVRPSVFKIVNYQNMNFVSPICAAHKSELTFAPPAWRAGSQETNCIEMGTIFLPTPSCRAHNWRAALTF